MNTLTRESLKVKIDKFLLDPDLQSTYYRLNLALDYAVEARNDENKNFTKQDVENYIFSDLDALDCGEVAEGTQLWDEIRDIQCDIVSYFES